MKVDVTDDKTRMQKVITIDHRSLLEPNFAVAIYSNVVERVSNQIAQEYLELNRSKLLAGLDIDVIKDLVNVQIASKVQKDHDLLMNSIDPMANSIPELNKNHTQRMKQIFGA